MGHNELVHYGVLGMRWGVRRSDAQLARTRGPRKTEAQKESVRQKKHDVRNRGALTNEELKQKINRLEAEKRLRELTNDEIYRGRNKVVSLLETIGTNTVTKVASTALSGAALYGIKSYVDGRFDWDDFGTAIFNGGPKKK